MLFSQHIVARLDEDAINIATNAAPAIERLAAARGEILAIPPLAAAGGPANRRRSRWNRAPFFEALAHLHLQLSAYLALPFYPGERAHFIEVEHAIHGISKRGSPAHRPPGSRGPSRRDGRSGDGTTPTPLVSTAPCNPSSRSTPGNNTDSPWRSQTAKPGDRVGYVLVAVTAILGLILMGLMMRAIRQYARLLRARNRLAINHAREVAAYGSKLGSIIAASTNISAAITTAATRTESFKSSPTMPVSSSTPITARLDAVPIPRAPSTPGVF